MRITYLKLFFYLLIFYSFSSKAALNASKSDSNQACDKESFSKEIQKTNLPEKRAEVQPEKYSVSEAAYNLSLEPKTCEKNYKSNKDFKKEAKVLSNNYLAATQNIIISPLKIGNAEPWWPTLGYANLTSAEKIEESLNRFTDLPTNSSKPWRNYQNLP
jgi:hypothetical protein